MKILNNFWLRGIGMMLLGGILFSACTEESLLDPNQAAQEDAAIMMDPSTFRSGYGLDPNSNARMAYGSADCTDEETYCVSSSNYYYKTDDKSWNAPRLGGVYLEYYQNVDGEMVYSFDSYKNNNGKDPNLVGYSIDGGPLVPVSKSSTITVTIPLEEEWAPCDEVNRSITVYRNSQHSLTFSTSYILLAVCDDDDGGGGGDDCEVEEFFYDHVGGYTYDFTYIPCEALTGATLKWTSPHIKAWSTDATLTTNPGKKRGTPTVLSWTGDVPAEGITVQITFDPDCTQTNAGFALLWTDFKVNEVSKKYLHSDNINILATNCPGKK